MLKRLDLKYLSAWPKVVRQGSLNVKFDSNATGPLDGVKVLDLTRLVAGNMLTLQLADMGADVIKVEPPGGDPMRMAGPFLHNIPHPDNSLNWLHFNTNKRSITLDITTKEGGHILRNLAQRADVLLETYQPGFLDDLKLGYRDLVLHIGGELNLGRAVERIKYRTHRLARRQYAWFRLSDKRIAWFDAETEIEQAEACLALWLAGDTPG